MSTRYLKVKKRSGSKHTIGIIIIKLRVMPVKICQSHCNCLRINILIINMQCHNWSIGFLPGTMKHVPASNIKLQLVKKLHILRCKHFLTNKNLSQTNRRTLKYAYSHIQILPRCNTRRNLICHSIRKSRYRIGRETITHLHPEKLSFNT